MVEKVHNHNMPAPKVYFYGSELYIKIQG